MQNRSTFLKRYTWFLKLDEYLKICLTEIVFVKINQIFRYLMYDEFPEARFTWDHSYLSFLVFCIVFCVFLNIIPDYRRRSNYQISYHNVDHQMGTTWCLSCMCSWRFQGARTDNCRYVWLLYLCGTCHRIPHPH